MGSGSAFANMTIHLIVCVSISIQSIVVQGSVHAYAVH